MQETNLPVTEVTQAGETMTEVGNSNKRARQSAREEVTEERSWTRSWRDTVADSPIFTGMFHSSARIEEENFESDDEEEIEDDENENIPSTAVWVHVPGLPIEYFDEGILVNIGKIVGTPLKVDYRTAWMTRGKFVRICVEVDLNKPLLSQIRIGNTIFNIEYEGLHLICFMCGMVGHKSDACPIKHFENPQTEKEKVMQQASEPKEAQEEELHKEQEREEKNSKEGRYEPWMMVQRRQKETRGSNRKEYNINQTDHKGNRFQALGERDDNENIRGEEKMENDKGTEEEQFLNNNQPRTEEKSQYSKVAAEKDKGKKKISDNKKNGKQGFVSGEQKKAVTIQKVSPGENRITTGGDEHTNVKVAGTNYRNKTTNNQESSRIISHEDNQLMEGISFETQSHAIKENEGKPNQQNRQTPSVEKNDMTSQMITDGEEPDLQEMALIKSYSYEDDKLELQGCG
ncbi:histone-lysine N-methyltransferase, H3 lysine-79 specific-like [Hibiscus syriacus]|uniref:histone-lysine N-methyltransferase, H3 lysine-79 specific-like n=1 Tax=Hibiscus syriacus TaxID=106335 RepID=UPI0019219811|nr:histone-lysine N-methyltransferase, H3 lysine-79 specific-like [Hibiscus syriacus]